MSMKSLFRRIFGRSNAPVVHVTNATNVSAPAAPDEPEVIPGSRFWIIWNPRHPNAPRVKHFKKSVAELVVKKMLRRPKHKDDVLYVMQVSSGWFNQDGRPTGRFY